MSAAGRDKDASATSIIGMTQTAATQKGGWYQHVSRGVAVAASTGAALISIVTALFSYGVIGKSELNSR